MNRIKKKLSEKEKCLSIYFTAGYPRLEDTCTIIESLERMGVDMLEIGLPFSDPLADGPVIQKSSTQALNNGMTTEKLFNQLEKIRDKVQIPLVIMGYFNPMFQYGMMRFLEKCSQIGIDGLIIPDLPMEIYQKELESSFKTFGIEHISLITPQTSEERIRFIDSISDSFIYMVSSAGTTGVKDSFDKEQSYFKRISEMKLKNPQIVGFGISNQKTFSQATEYCKGVIIGSAFINHLRLNGINTAKMEHFIKNVLG